MTALDDRDLDLDDRPTLLDEIPRVRVLVAEDDAALRDLVVSTLERDGYAVDQAVSGAGALASLESLEVAAWPAEAVDLLVVDMCMPGLNGLDVLRRLRAAHWTTPAILMTAFAAPEVIAEACRLGALVLSKPFPLDMLTRTARALIEHVGEQTSAHGFKLS